MQVAQRCERLTEWNSYRAKLIEQATNRRIIAVAFRGSTSIYGVQRGSETSAPEPVAASVAAKTMVVNNRFFCEGLLMPPRLCAAIWAGGRWWWMPQARHRSRPAGSRARCNSPRLAAADPESSHGVRPVAPSRRADTGRRAAARSWRMLPLAVTSTARTVHRADRRTMPRTRPTRRPSRGCARVNHP
jgi:hypothetical protein